MPDTHAPHPADEFMPVAAENVPAVQFAHSPAAVSPGVPEKLPARQAWHDPDVPAPSKVENVPAVQLVQTFWLTIPIPVAYVPAMHATQADRPVLEAYVPAVQFRHVRPCTYVPTAQEMHVLPEPSELVPAEQAWQALLWPSIKYWPPPQHTPVPFVRQWRV